jgi:hypothetical protein
MGTLENMCGFACPKCGETFGHVKHNRAKAMAVEMSVPFLGQIPIDPRIAAAGEAGTPFFAGDAQSPAAKAFADTVDAILAADDQQNHRRRRSPVLVHAPAEAHVMRTKP